MTARMGLVNPQRSLASGHTIESGAAVPQLFFPFCLTCALNNFLCPAHCRAGRTAGAAALVEPGLDYSTCVCCLRQPYYGTSLVFLNQPPTAFVASPLTLLPSCIRISCPILCKLTATASIASGPTSLVCLSTTILYSYSPGSSTLRVFSHPDVPHLRALHFFSHRLLKAPIASGYCPHPFKYITR